MKWYHVRRALKNGQTVSAVIAHGADAGTINRVIDAEAKQNPVGRVPSREVLDRLYGNQIYEDIPARPAR
jgi:hypothetical protein